MRIPQILANRNGKPTLSLEFFRPKTEKAAQNFEAAMDTLSESNPDYVTVTFGAGGSSRRDPLSAGGQAEKQAQRMI